MKVIPYKDTAPRITWIISKLLVVVGVAVAVYPIILEILNDPLTQHLAQVYIASGLFVALFGEAVKAVAEIMADKE